MKEKLTKDNGQMTMDNFQLSTVKSQLPKGYKNTEIGVIPEEWEMKEVKDLESKVNRHLAKMGFVI